MSIKVGGIIGSGTEQKHNKDSAQKKHLPFDLDLSKLIYAAVQEILEKDEYDLLETKAKVLLDSRISAVDNKIKKMISTNIKGKEKTKKMLNSVKILKLENDKKIKFLNEKLR